MSTLCNGKVLQEGHIWSCVDCGCIGTSWSKQHSPMTSKAALFLASLREVIAEVNVLDNVEAVQPAM